MSIDLTGITSITQDSRHVTRGSLFVALKGEKVDGVRYIEQAKSLGAVAVLVDENAELPQTDIRVIRSANPRLAMARIAQSLSPGQPEHLVAVTGTDGKTSTAEFFRQLTEKTGYTSASIGTLGVIGEGGRTLTEGTHTSPDAISLHRMLSDLYHGGVSHACVEASSHGLHQYRLHAARIEAAAFTNIARDHLDYHHTEEEYFRAKAMLFSELLPVGKTAVININDARAAELRSICEGRSHQIIGFGRGECELSIQEISPTPAGQEVQANLLGRSVNLNIPLVGMFQTMNILAAIGLAHATGISLEALIDAAPALSGVPGRLELAGLTDTGAGVYVDYAHTPAALANILTTLRPHTHGKLHVVFGCGGNRDAGKRAPMGKAAHDLADVIIVTDDNPRGEDAATIRETILTACPGATEIADRAKAIRHAISGLAAGDVLVIAGKGHEKKQIIGNVEHPHDDVAVARAALEEK